ncbi:MAG TPA: ABC transporter ATP-binding protein, partial [Candidatus Cloacimonetes bacterium]|nr:ABC transporter ATP-binding protein [Candidatus Cloacimonadota bacterium]
MTKNIISIKNLKKEFSEKIICENETFGIHEKDKIGLIGINGCGKTTLLKMLVGIESADEGTITFRKDITTGYLPQIPQLNPELSIYEQIYFSEKKEFHLIRKYYKILDELKSHQSKLNEEYQKLIKEMDAQNVWEIEIKAKSILSKLGFKDISQKIKILSGGQKRRVDLARVLMDDPDVLFLDEPTNHLDIDTIEWLQEYFRNYNGIIVFITHDRYFLDAVANKIMEIEKCKIRFYYGNYSYYLKKKEMESFALQRKEIRRTSQLKKELKWLQRGAKARTSKPKDHLDRVKELIDKSYLTNDSELDISFVNKRMGKTILEIHNVAKSYEKELFKNFSHIFQKNERIGIIGANGCGKTTLLKIITNEIKPDAGKIKAGMNTHFSYFKQDAGDFSKNKTVIEHIREFADNIRTSDGVLHSASEMLQKFLFDKKMQQNKISSLSGGEKKRLYLLRSLMFGSNFIILDEPTNDLDIKTLEILEDYLDAFKGCILVVSHDRFFLDRVVDYLFIFEEDRIVKFPGNYSDYLLVKRFREEKTKIQNTKKTKLLKTKIQKEKTTKLSYNEKRELEFLENEIEELEDRKIQLEKKIENEASSLSHLDFKSITDELKKIEDKLNKSSERWLELE